MNGSRTWIRAAACGAVSGIVLALIGYLRPPQYTARLMFAPSSQSVGRLAGLAAQFGISGIGVDNTVTPAFYQTLLGTEEFASAVAERMRRQFPEQYVVAMADAGVDSASRIASVEVGRMLNDLVSVGASAASNTVRVSYTSADDSAAYAVVQSYLDEALLFDQERRALQARAERSFLERQSAAVADSVAKAEAALESFLRENRALESSSALQLQQERLTRVVTRTRALQDQVEQALASARLDEVRDTPQLTVLIVPDLPPAEDPRHVFLLLLVGVIVGSAVATVYQLRTSVAHAVLGRVRTSIDSSGNRGAP